MLEVGSCLFDLQLRLFQFNDLFPIADPVHATAIAAAAGAPSFIRLQSTDPGTGQAQGILLVEAADRMVSNPVACGTHGADPLIVRIAHRTKAAAFHAIDA